MFPYGIIFMQKYFPEIELLVDVYRKHFPKNSYANLVLFVLWENKMTNNENYNTDLFIDLAKATWEKRQRKANDNGKEWFQIPILCVSSRQYSWN